MTYFCFKSEEEEYELREAFFSNRFILCIGVGIILIFGVSVYYTIDCYSSPGVRCNPQLLMTCITGVCLLVLCCIVLRWIFCMPSKKIPILPIVEPSSIENPMHQIPSKLDRRGSVPSIEFTPERSRSRSSSKDSTHPKSPKSSKTSRRNFREFLPNSDSNDSFVVQNPMDRAT